MALTIVVFAGKACVVSFDLSLLEALQGSKHQDGIYNTTCTAVVQIGFGEACDDFLDRGGIDCSTQTQRDVFSTASGTILFSLPTSSAVTVTAHVILALLMAGEAYLFLVH